MFPKGKPVNGDLTMERVNLICAFIIESFRVDCVHRDLSFRHFLISDNGKMIPIDFGFSIEHGNQDVFQGSVHYSPNSVLELLCAAKDRKIVWSVLYNVETLFKLIYSQLFSFFRAQLLLIPADDYEQVLAFWKKHETKFAPLFKEFFTEARMIVSNGSKMKLEDAKQCCIELINRFRVALIRFVPGKLEVETKPTRKRKVDEADLEYGPEFNKHLKLQRSSIMVNQPLWKYTKASDKTLKEIVAVFDLMFVPGACRSDGNCKQFLKFLLQVQNYFFNMLPALLRVFSDVYLCVCRLA